MNITVLRPRPMLMDDSFPMEAFGRSVLLFFALFAFAPGETIEIDAGS